MSTTDINNNSSRMTHRLIIETLEELVRLDGCPPTQRPFITLYERFLSLFDRYQHEILETQQRSPVCQRGCMTCCYHWVEDVYSFETIIIAERLKHRYPALVPHVLASCRSDIKLMEQLDAELEIPLAECPPDDTMRDFDERTQQLLKSFYALRRPCPLLNDDHCCLVYDIRPLTCRTYLSFSTPDRCDPRFSGEPDMPIQIVDVDETASSLLDLLHTRYDRFSNDTSLRSALATCLSELFATGETV